MTTRFTSPFTLRSTATDVLADSDLSQRRFLVTGGGTGLGLQTALALRHAGAEVTITTRRPLEGSDVEGLRQVRLDLADLKSLERLLETWEGPLDGLVANAGIMALPTRQTTAQGWEMQLATNYLGHLLLARGLHPHLADAAAQHGEARLVVLSSGAHRNAAVDLDDPQFERRDYDRWTAYAQSKTADVLLAVSAASRWESEGIVANAVNPGWINTGLQRHVDDETMQALGAMDEAGNLVEADYYKTPQQGASTATLLAGSPLVTGISGRYFEDNQEAEVLDEGDHGVAPHALDLGTAERLWTLAEAAAD